MELKALSLTLAVNDWLAKSHQPRILHIFDRACNLINERREVLSIVTPQIGNGPFNLLLEEDILFSGYFSSETPVSLQENQLILGDIIINTANAKLWSPRPDWEMLHTKRKDLLNQLTSLSVSAERPSLPTQLLSTFSTSLVAADLAASLYSAEQLAGLGMGLTPAGDDFILGALLAGWIIHPLDVANVLAREITNMAAPLTTSLSAAWLRSAGRGEAGMLWHDFFYKLVSADPVQTQNAMDKILEVGETSGADALSGFVGVFIHLRNRQIQKIH